MLMHTREGATVVWHSRKKIPTKPDNRWTIHFKDSALFDPFCCRERIISYLRWAVFIFTMDKPIWAKPSFTWYIFLKFDTSLAKSTTICLLEFFYRLSKKSFVRFLYGVGPLATSSLAWWFRSLKSSLKLDSAVVSIGSSETFLSFSHFSWY